MTDIAIIDYGMGNLHSVSKAFEYVAPSASIILQVTRMKFEKLRV